MLLYSILFEPMPVISYERNWSAGYTQESVVIFVIVFYKDFTVLSTLIWDSDPAVQGTGQAVSCNCITWPEAHMPHWALLVEEQKINPSDITLPAIYETWLKFV